MPGADAFDLTFRRNLERGFVEGSEGKPVADLKANLTNLPAVEPAPAGFTLRFDADSHTYDGRFANNGWLQETPDPLTKLMWDNALILSVKDARHLDVDMGDLVEVTVPGAVKPMVLPVYLLPGQPGGVASLSLGYGRTAAGPVGEGLGFNSSPFARPAPHGPCQTCRSSRSPAAINWSAPPSITFSARRRRGRGIPPRPEATRPARSSTTVTLEEYKQNPKDAGGTVRRVGLQLFAPTVDNVPRLARVGHGRRSDGVHRVQRLRRRLPGREQHPDRRQSAVQRHREMNWIRIDRYFKGEAEDAEPEVVYQPMMCQHCENAAVRAGVPGGGDRA